MSLKIIDGKYNTDKQKIFWDNGLIEDVLLNSIKVIGSKDDIEKFYNNELDKKIFDTFKCVR